MRRLPILAAAALVAISLLVLLLVWRPLHDPRVRGAVEARLSAMLGQPVRIGDLGLRVYPWLALSGSGVRVGETDVQAPALEIHRVVIRPRVGALLRGDIGIEDVRLEGFVMSVLRDREGRWHFPPAVPAPVSQEDAGVTIERVRVMDGSIRVFDGGPDGGMHQTASIDDLETTVEPATDGVRLAPITARIGHAPIRGEARANSQTVQLEFSSDRLSHGDLPQLLALLRAERPEFLQLPQPASLSADMHVARDTSRPTGTGTLRAPEVRLDTVVLRQFEAPFSVEGGRLDFTPTAFTLYGGSHTGSVTIRVEEPTRWTLDSRVTGLNVEAFLNTVAGADQRLEGTGTVTASLTGRIDEALRDTANGRIHLVVTDGVIREFALLAAIDRALGLTDQEAGDTTFERLSATFEIAGATAHTHDLLIEAGHARILASGRIGADGTIDMRGAAVLSPERSKQAITSVRELSGLRNTQGEVEIPLTIGGTLDAPAFGVDLKAAIGKGIRDELRRRLQRIIKR